MAYDRREADKRWRKSPKGKAAQRRGRKRYRVSKKGVISEKRSMLKFRYGLTLEEWQQMFEQQKGCCAICGKHQSILKKPLGVDHNHVSGKIRKLLCFHCNLALGIFNVDEEGINLLQNAINYIKEMEDES